MSLSLLLTVMVSLATLCEFDTSEKVCRKRSQHIIPLIPSERTYLCLNVFPLPVPLEGGQWVAMVRVAGEGQLVPLPQRVGGQAGDARSLRGAQDLDRFRVLDQKMQSNVHFTFPEKTHIKIFIIHFILSWFWLSQCLITVLLSYALSY